MEPPQTSPDSTISYRSPPVSPPLFLQIACIGAMAYAFAAIAAGIALWVLYTGYWAVGRIQPRERYLFVAAALYLLFGLLYLRCSILMRKNSRVAPRIAFYATLVQLFLTPLIFLIYDILGFEVGDKTLLITIITFAFAVPALMLILIPCGFGLRATGDSGNPGTNFQLLPPQ